MRYQLYLFIKIFVKHNPSIHWYDCFSVLSDPQERQWYDDHREAILRGGNGTKTDDDDSDSEEYVINLWKYFNASCFDGFDDSPKGFYVVYGDVFSRIWAQEQESSSKIHSDEPKFGNADSPAPDVLRFYNHWSCFASCRNFSWEDKYNQSEAPNRQVRRYWHAYFSFMILSFITLFLG